MIDCQKLQKLCHDIGYTLEDVADRLGISRARLSSIKQEVSTPTLKHAVRLAKIYNCKVDDLIKPLNYTVEQV